MGMGWRVVLERELPGVAAIAVDGKALIFRQRDLAVLAESLGLAPLTDFVSSNPAALASYLKQQGLDPESFPIPDEEWYSAAEGLETVRGLLGHLRAHPAAQLDGDRIICDLAAIEQILTAAEQAQLMFHLASDLPTLDVNS